MPKAKDTGATYGNNVQSSGPYMFETYRPRQGRHLFVRNTNWDQATDEIRTPLVDKIT